MHTLEERGFADEVWVGRLGEERNDGDTRVSTNNDNVLVYGVGVLDLADEAGSAHNIKGSNTEKTLRVIDTSLLEDLSNDWDGAVDRVGDDEDFGIGCGFGSGFGEVADDRGIGVEEIVTAHAGLSGDTGGDEHDLSALECGIESGITGLVASYLALGVDVADICGDTWREGISYAVGSVGAFDIPGASLISYRARSEPNC